MKWTTKEGATLQITEMSDSHLINTIKFLIRGSCAAMAKAKCFALTCPMPMGEQACWDVEHGTDQTLDSDIQDYFPKILEHMIKEGQKRKLSLDFLTSYEDKFNVVGDELVAKAMLKILEEQGNGTNRTL